MSALLKSLGAIVLLIGVCILAVPVFTETRSNNTILATGLIVIIVGFFVHIFLNRKFQ